MMRNIPTKRLNTVIFLTFLFFVLELLGRGGEMLPGIVILGLMAYIGWKQYDTTFGKIICWIGIVGLLAQTLSLFAFQFFVVAVLVLLFLEYRKQDKEEEWIRPDDRMAEESSLQKKDTLFKHRFAGRQVTPQGPYQWRDIHVQSGFGSKTIDLSNTVIHDTAVVSIRHLFGKITVLVPYDLEVQFHHSTFYGTASIFEEKEKLMNETISYETEGYEAAKARVKIIISMLSGDVEVKRV
jgi:lia operon protein LiaF